MKSNAAGLQGSGPGFSIHKADHQDFPGGIVLHYCWNQAIHFVKINRHLHSFLAIVVCKQKARRFASRRAFNPDNCAELAATGLRRHVRHMVMMVMTMCAVSHIAFDVSQPGAGCQIIDAGEMSTSYRGLGGSTEAVEFPDECSLVF